MIVQLENEYLCVTLTTLGGALSSIKKKGSDMEYLWQGDPEYWSGQAPVLFPICGSLRDDQAQALDGTRVTMPRHGIVRKREFKLEEQTKTMVSFSIESNDEMYTMFPWRFLLQIQYQLQEAAIQITYKISNLERRELPYFIGGHPAFNCPLEAAREYSDYEIIFDKQESCTVPMPITETGLIDMAHRTKLLENTNRLALAHQLFAEDAVILDQLKSRSVCLTDKDHKHGVRLQYEDFSYLILWSSANNGPFIAIEPWSGLSTCSDEDDILEHKRSVSTVGPEDEDQKSYTITVF